MNARQAEMLRQLAHGPRTARSWTDGVYALPHNAIASHLRSLVEDGYVSTTGNGESAVFAITDDGRDALAASGPVAQSRVICNASSRAPYIPPRNESVRGGADQHKRFLSVGAGC